MAGLETKANGRNSPTDALQSMLRVCMWNTRGKKVSALLRTLAWQHDLNVLVLLENTERLADLLTALNSKTEAPWFYAWGTCPRVTHCPGWGE